MSMIVVASSPHKLNHFHHILNSSPLFYGIAFKIHFHLARHYWVNKNLRKIGEV